MKRKIIGVDLGGTNVRAGKIDGVKIVEHFGQKISSYEKEEVIINEVKRAIAEVFDSEVEGIGVGVPSMVDVERGIVYDVQNIPSWEVVHLKEILEREFNVPVFINNDANCFALGEKYFGKAKDFDNVVGLISGTGLGGGLILNGKLFNGHNCSAGEFGMIEYKDHDFEYYCSGQFFKNIHNTSGEIVAEAAARGDEKALAIMDELGQHMGKAIKALLFAVDPELIVFGGSVSKAYSFFASGIQKSLEGFPYKEAVKNLKIEVSENPQIAILGAASLFLEKVIENPDLTKQFKNSIPELKSA